MSRTVTLSMYISRDNVGKLESLIPTPQPLRTLQYACAQGIHVDASSPCYRDNKLPWFSMGMVGNVGTRMRHGSQLPSYNVF